MIAAEPERLEQMRRGLVELVRQTGQDFGFDLAKWRDFLLTHDEFGYRHPYAFRSVDRAVKAAIEDPEFARLAPLAAAGVQEFAAQLAREKQARLDAIAANDARITNNRCPFCDKPCPTYRFTCPQCGKQVRERK